MIGTFRTLPAALPLFAGGLGFVGYLTGRRKRKAGRSLPRKPIDKLFLLMQTEACRKTI